MFFTMVIASTAVIVYHYMTENQIKEMDSQIESSALESDNNLNKTLSMKIQQLESTFTTKISELEANYSAELASMKEMLNKTEERLINATIMITELEEKHLLTFREMEAALNETEGLLQDATAAISMLEENHAMAIKVLEEELNTTNMKLEEVMTAVEEVDISTTAKTTELEAKLQSAETEIATLNITKASKVVVNEITDRVADLETGKVDKTEFAILSDNVRSNFEQLVIYVSDLENSTVQTSDFVRLVESIENTTAEIWVEIALKANQSEINTLTEQITNLTATVVDRVEFDSLSINVTILRESTALEDETLHAEIEALADGSLNLTHHDQLKILIEQFALTKANQTDFEDLAFDVVTLANGTVRTNDFNQLAETVDGIDHTTMIIQDNISDLALNFTTLKSNVSHLNSVLVMKADQQQVDTLEDKLATLVNTTVERSTFKLLQDRVESLATNKANQSTLEQLKETVELLNKTTTDEITLQEDLAETLTNHTISSQETHNQLTLNITSNYDDIQNNMDGLTTVQEELKELQDSSQRELIPMWLTIIASLSFIFFIHLHMY